ncbi:MAG: arylsulfotransferase family protein [Haloarculaceae archaeon]
MSRRSTRVFLATAALVVLVFVTSALFAPKPGVENATGGPESMTVVGLQGSGTGLQGGGQAVGLSPGGDREWGVTDANSYFDVTPLGDGRYLAAFMSGQYGDCEPYSAPCAHTGFRILDPSRAGSAAVVSEYSFPVRNRTDSEVHAAAPLEDGTVVFADMDRERVAVVAPDNGTVLWQWNASSFYEAPPDPTRRDWLHINDVDPLGDGRFLVSVRNANQLLVLQRGEGVVQVINADPGGSDSSCLRSGQLYDASGDGDVRCGDPTLIDHQHDPQWLGDGAVLVADSDNNRVVELHRENGTWHQAWVSTGANDIHYSWPRDADRLPNGHTLVTDSLNDRVVEVTESGQAVWSATTDENPYDAERLPHGEQVGGPTYERQAGAADQSGGTIPVLTRLTHILKFTFPLPTWFSERHTLILIAAVVVGVAGLADAIYSRLRG